GERVSPRGRHGARPPVPQNLRRGGSSPAALPLAGERAGTPERHSPGDPPRYGGDRAGAPVGPPRRAVPGDRTLGRAGAGRVLSPDVTSVATCWHDRAHGPASC